MRALKFLRAPWGVVSWWSALQGILVLSLHYILASSLLPVTRAGRFYISYPRKYCRGLLMLTNFSWPQMSLAGSPGCRPGSCSLARTCLLFWDALELCRWLLTWVSRQLRVPGHCFSSHLRGTEGCQEVRSSEGSEGVYSALFLLHTPPPPSCAVQPQDGDVQTQKDSFSFWNVLSRVLWMSCLETEVWTSLFIYSTTCFLLPPDHHSGFCLWWPRG